MSTTRRALRQGAADTLDAIARATIGSGAWAVVKYSSFPNGAGV